MRTSAEVMLEHGEVSVYNELTVYDDVTVALEEAKESADQDARNGALIFKLKWA